MIWSVLLFDLVPLIAFAVLDAFGNVRYALIGAILAALLNLLYSQFFLGGIDAISLIFVGLIVFFAGLSYYAQNPLFFKENTRMFYGDAKASLDKLLGMIN